MGGRRRDWAKGGVLQRSPIVSGRTGCAPSIEFFLKCNKPKA
jgi:hypothetical protein